MDASISCCLSVYFSRRENLKPLDSMISFIPFTAICVKGFSVAIKIFFHVVIGYWVLIKSGKQIGLIYTDNKGDKIEK